MKPVTDQAYLSYLRTEIELYRSAGSERQRMCLEATNGIRVKRVLDVGCGAGQEMLAFAEAGAFCVGIDIAPELGALSNELFDSPTQKNNISFVRAAGEAIPFSDASFDVVVCRVALPYMQIRPAISEISRVLRVGGVAFVKIHAFAFHAKMAVKAAASLNPKRVAYPLIAIAGGVHDIVFGTQPHGYFWSTKEIFQVDSRFRRLMIATGFKQPIRMPDDAFDAPSYMFEKAQTQPTDHRS